jgi:tRNA pseudouridine38-40 synthase
MTVQRYKAVLAYDGTAFSGFQVQPDKRTIQGELEKTLKKMSKGHTVKVHGAGRTDAGVHARGQVVHFDFPFYIEPKGMHIGLNSMTPEDITVTTVELTDADFHSRFQAKGKMYKYTIDNNQFLNPFVRHYAYHHRYPMTLEPVEEAMSYLIGTHDFTSFASTKSEVEDKVRTIYQASVEQDISSNTWVFTFVGNGFLYNMIRILMGILVEVASGQRSASDIPMIIQARDREAAGKTLAPEGLCMERVYYDEKDIPGFSDEGEDRPDA